MKIRGGSKKTVSRSLEGKDFGNLVAPLFVKIREGLKKKVSRSLEGNLEILSLLFS